MEFDTDIVHSAVEKIKEYPGAWENIYKECKEDEEFSLLGTHMSPELQTKYGLQNARQQNLLKPYVNNQANQTLQNHYRAIVSPNGGGSDITKARQREQVLRGQQRNGAAQTYNQARRYQLAAGIHYSRIEVDYASDRGNEKEYRYADCTNTYNIFPEPAVMFGDCTFSGMKDFLIKEDVPKSQWKDKTGEDWSYGATTSKTIWYYWRKKETSKDFQYITMDGKEAMGSELFGDGEPDYSMVQMEDDKPLGRDVSSYEWEWAIILEDSKKELKRGNWLGCYPPLVACTGEKVIETTPSGELKVHFYSLIHDAKEPQIMFDIVENIKMLRLARSPYGMWKIPFESVIQKQNEEYRESAVTGMLDMIYKSLTENGDQIPPPEFMEPHILDRVLLELQQQYQQQIERILGIYDAALGQRTNEKSGVAIKERAKMSNLSNYHFEFNFLEYVKQLGNVVLESMPKYLTAQQQLMFVDRDDKAVVEMINTPGGVEFNPNERYSMMVEVEPNSDSNREAEAEALMEMAANPVLGPIIAKTPGAAADVIKAQKGKFAQQLGAKIEQAANDPEKQAMKQQMEEMRKQGQALQEQLKQLQASQSLEEFKETNRHKEAMAKLQLESAKNADEMAVKAFDANTKREQTNAIPQIPNSLPVPGADAIT
jgi:hypothetical protein